MEKKVYTYTGNTATPASTAVYTYHYDHIGNVLMISDTAGHKVYNFEQDAFGNELTLPSTPFAGSAWATARTAGISEHQTGKWNDPLTGLYYFQARWYDPLTGRFVGRDPLFQAFPMTCQVEKARYFPFNPYLFSSNSPVMYTDPNGLETIQACTREKKTGAPGTHCYLCFNDQPASAGNVDCQGCQINKGQKQEIPSEGEVPLCISKKVSNRDICCIRNALKECCDKYKIWNPISWFTSNCCDCARKALAKCGFKSPNLDGINCGL